MKQKIKFLCLLLITNLIIKFPIYSQDAKVKTDKIVIVEKEDFKLMSDVTSKFGYDSILILKGNYPVSFDKNKFGQVTFKIVKEYGTGNGTTSIVLFGGHKRYSRRTGLYCRSFGFSCGSGNGGAERSIKCKFTKQKGSITISFLSKVPFGEKGYELE